MSDSETPTGRGAGDTHSSKKKKKQATAAASAQQQQVAQAARLAAQATQRAHHVQARATSQSQQQQQQHPASAPAPPHSSEAQLQGDMGLQREAEADPEQQESGEDEDEQVAVMDTPVSMQALLVHLMQQQKKDKAAAKAARAQDRALIAQLQAQLQQQAMSTVRLGTTTNTGALAPASRSTLRVEADVAAQHQAAGAAAAPDLQQQQRALSAAEAARAPSAPGVHAAALAAPPRRELPKVKQELEAAGLSKDPTLLKSWVFEMERLLRAMELSSAQQFTFGDRLSVAQDHWDAGIDAWWTTLCDGRATAMQPAVCSWAGLIAALHETYGSGSDGLTAARGMHQIKQGASESMEAYVRRVLELQGRIPSGRLPSHVVGDLALNGADESRFPWTLSIIRGEAMAFANSQPSGQGPDMSFIAHRLRTQAGSEPKVVRTSGAGSSELNSIKAELAKLQRQVAQNSQVMHAAAINTAQPTESQGSEGSNRKSSAGKRGWRPGGRNRTDQGTAAGAGGTGSSQRKQLDDDELARRFEAGLCFECNKPGHIGRDCPERAAKKKKQQEERLRQQGAEGAPSPGN